TVSFYRKLHRCSPDRGLCDVPDHLRDLGFDSAGDASAKPPLALHPALGHRQRLLVSGNLRRINYGVMHDIPAGDTTVTGGRDRRSRRDSHLSAGDPALGEDISGSRSFLRDSVASMDHSQRDHLARISALGAEEFQFAGRTGPLRLDELGKNLAVSVP